MAQLINHRKGSCMHELYSTRLEALNTLNHCHTHNDFVSINPQESMEDDERQDNNVAVHTVNRNILSPKCIVQPALVLLIQRTLINKNKRREVACLFEMIGIIR